MTILNAFSSEITFFEGIQSCNVSFRQSPWPKFFFCLRRHFSIQCVSKVMFCHEIKSIRYTLYSLKSSTVMRDLNIIKRSETCATKCKPRKKLVILLIINDQCCQLYPFSYNCFIEHRTKLNIIFRTLNELEWVHIWVIELKHLIFGFKRTDIEHWT